MSIYPVQYTSESKGAIDIESMHDHHLLNAWRKLDLKMLADHQRAAAVNEDYYPDKAEVLLESCLKTEIAARGLDPKYRSGKPPEPPIEAYEGEADAHDR